MQRSLTIALTLPVWLALFGWTGCDTKSRGAGTCEVHSDCDQLERCVDGVCRAIECQFSGDCPSGQYCVDYACVAGQTCESDADCEDPTPICNLDTGVCSACVPRCTGLCCGDDGCGGECPNDCADTGQICNPDGCACEGECVPACEGKQCGPDGCGDTCPPGCGDQERCVQGTCQAAGCGSDADCVDPTPHCDLDSGACLECLDAGDCAAGQICSGGVCAGQAVCVDDSQCEMGQICVAGACVTGCKSNRDCPDGWTCLPDDGPNGTCVECQADGDCGPGRACQDGRCVDHCTSDAHCTPLHCDQASNQCVACTEDGHCPDGEICLALACEPGCRLDEDCASGHCNDQTHACVECLSIDDCPLGSLCVVQQCVAGCSGNRDCPADLQCDPDLGEYGTCVECLADADCAAGYRCVTGLCEFHCSTDQDCQAPRPACDPGSGVCVECSSNDHCTEGTICIQQACLPGCESDRDCPAGLVCDADLGQHGGCVECLVDGDCPAGYTCDGSHCIIEGSEMIRLPGGAFTRGSDAGEGEADEEPEATVTVPTFYIDRTEVTNDQYRTCVQAGVCTTPADTQAYDDPAKGNHPVTWVTWSQVDDFCTWMGKGLPTEARWERAARGTQDERIYPWGGGDPDCARTNYSGCAGGPLPVGSHPTGATPAGVQDLAGNVYEWVYDRYSETYYTDGGTDDPFGPLEGDYRVIRGGGFDSPAANIRVANRGARTPDSGHADVGFRCALRGAPVASFVVNPEVGPYDLTTFSVDASSTTDANHPTDSLDVRWDWEDDDAWDTTWTSAKAASHRYAFHGIFRIRLEVRDPDGNTDQATTEVVAEGDTGWDGAACETVQDCAHGFSCVLDWSIFSYVCREDCIWLLEPTCHIPGRTCKLTLDPVGNACMPE